MHNYFPILVISQYTQPPPRLQLPSAKRSFAARTLFLSISFPPANNPPVTLFLAGRGPIADSTAIQVSCVFSFSMYSKQISPHHHPNQETYKLTPRPQQALNIHPSRELASPDVGVRVRAVITNALRVAWPAAHAEVQYLQAGEKTLYEAGELGVRARPPGSGTRVLLRL